MKRWHLNSRLIPGLRAVPAILCVSFVWIVGCHHTWRRSAALSEQETKTAITKLRAAYHALNGGDIDARSNSWIRKLNRWGLPNSREAELITESKAPGSILPNPGMALHK
jgi:hypothetical protein